MRRSLDPTLDSAGEALAWYSSRPEATGIPTSSISGTGAIDELERRAAADHGVRHGIAVSSATLALRAGLRALQLGPATNVFVRREDWPAGRAAANALGLSVTAVEDWGDGSPQRGDVVVVVADANGRRAPGVEALADDGVTMIDDVSHRWGGTVTGVFGITSLGSGKAIDAGEGGLLLTDSDVLAERVEHLTQHPNRHLLRGYEPSALALSCRMHPVAAVIALWRLSESEYRTVRSVRTGMSSVHP
jgi:dTDP-4-amino-4,6-dideoxygalactose transaminase